jgi:hypothetical protein
MDRHQRLPVIKSELMTRRTDLVVAAALRTHRLPDRIALNHMIDSALCQPGLTCAHHACHDLLNAISAHPTRHKVAILPGAVTDTFIGQWPFANIFDSRRHCTELMTFDFAFYSSCVGSLDDQMAQLMYRFSHCLRRESRKSICIV